MHLSVSPSPCHHPSDSRSIKTRKSVPLQVSELKLANCIELEFVLFCVFLHPQFQSCRVFCFVSDCTAKYCWMRNLCHAEVNVMLLLVLLLLLLLLLRDDDKSLARSGRKQAYFSVRMM